VASVLGDVAGCDADRESYLENDVLSMWMHHFRKKRGSLDRLASSGARTLGRGRWIRSAPEGTPPPDVTTAVSAPGHLTLAGIVPQLHYGFVEEAEAVVRLSEGWPPWGLTHRTPRSRTTRWPE
jgi:hypothetical protein